MTLDNFLAHRQSPFLTKQSSAEEIEAIIEKITTFMREYTLSSGAKGLILGISGGVDSSLLAFLIKRAFPQNALGVLIPCHSSQQDIELGKKVCEKAGLAHRVIDISAEHSMLLKSILGDGASKLIDGNLRARLRMSVLYALAGSENYLVVGTDNAAELFTGYFTKFGDGGVDLLPIADLLKREVYILSEHVGVPQEILTRKPTAGLWEGQTDESEMGVTYDDIDYFLEYTSTPFDGKQMPLDQMLKKLIEKMGEDTLMKINSLHRISQHKRILPPIGRI